MKRNSLNFLYAFLMCIFTLAFIPLPAAAQHEPVGEDKPAATTQDVAEEPAVPADARTLGPGQAPVTVTQIPRFDVKDLFGRIIFGQDLDGWIVLYCFGNEDTAEQGVEWLKRLTLSNFDAEGILYVIVADASRYHKALFPIVKKKAKGAYDDYLQDFRKQLDEKGYEYDFQLEDRYIMTLDTAAAIFDVFEIQDRSIPHVFIMDGNHTVRGHFTEYSDDTAKVLTDVLAERDAKKQAEDYQLTMKTRKRQMWKRYALVGGLAWLLLK